MFDISKPFSTWRHPHERERQSYLKNRPGNGSVSSGRSCLLHCMLQDAFGLAGQFCLRRQLYVWPAEAHPYRNINTRFPMSTMVTTIVLPQPRVGNPEYASSIR